jgi:hypothetical protein
MPHRKAKARPKPGNLLDACVADRNAVHAALVPSSIVSVLKPRPDPGRVTQAVYPQNPCTELWITSGRFIQLVGAKAIFRFA